MSIETTHTIHNLELAMSDLASCEGVIAASELAALVQRFDAQNSHLARVKDSAQGIEDLIVSSLEHKLISTSMNMDVTTDLEERHMMWHELYLAFGALDFLGLSATASTVIEQTLLAIDEDWTDVRGFAKHCNLHFPASTDSQTDRLVQQTLSPASFEEEFVCIDLAAHRRVEQLASIQVEIDTMTDEPEYVIRFMAAAGGEDRLEEIMVDETWSLSVLFDGEVPEELILNGTTAVQATCNDVAVEHTVDGNGCIWSFQTGRWVFTINGSAHILNFR